MHWWIPRVPDFQAFAPSLDIRISTLTGPLISSRQRCRYCPCPWQTERGKTDITAKKLGDDDLVLRAARALLKNQMGLSVEQLVKQNPTIGAFNPRRQHDWQVWCDHYQIPMPIVPQ